ncbi:toll-like receptor 13 [Bufo bufo]|uniref:toll-like receptor 13 n=1 Tax=Bufo bufo TaxID=8384 RepID=UPI001ABDEF44|nr:toll-like receptor 13 [Bufo bufo]
MKFPLVLVLFGALFISLVTGYGFRNCIQKYESYTTFICMNRQELSIYSVVSDIPNFAKNLTISQNTIKILPSRSFHHLSQLQSLILSHNHLQAVDLGAFENLEALYYLDLSYNNICNLSSGVFCGLKRLAHLHLQNNALVFMHLKVFSPLLSLKSLNLSANGLSNFSSVVHALQPLNQLKNLSLCGNNIRHLSHALSLPSNLSTLFLCRNQLQDLKCHQDFLGQIKYLDLSHNNLTSSSLQKVNLTSTNYLTVASNPDFDILKFLENPTIPPERIDYSRLNINTTAKLREMCSYLRGKEMSHLNLIGNNFWFLPNRTLSDCSQSTQMDLSHNRLKNVTCLRFLKPSNLSTVIIEHNLLKRLDSCHNAPIFPKLTSISFRYNRIWSVMPNAFTFAPKLKTLKLNINNIMLLSKRCFYELRHLQMLRLDNNLITDLYYNSFLGLGKLTTLILRNNRVSVIFENVFQNLENLIILDLGGNKITQVKKGSFIGMKSLSKLYLDNNQIKQISGDMFNGVEATLQVLDLKSNQLRYLSSQQYVTPFSKLQKIYDLKLQSQQPHGLTTIPRGFFTGLDNLRALYLGQNRLTRLGYTVFDELRNLTYLNLGEDCNGVQNLSPGIFKNLINLRYLDLENMCIQSLSPDIFSHLSNLRRLQLTKNGLKQIDVKIFDNMTKLKYLDICKCPLTCTCDNEEFQRWMNVSHVQTVYAYNITCSNDPHVFFHSFDTHVCDLKEKLILFSSSFSFLCLLIIIPIVYSKSYWRIKYNYFLFISWLNERWNSNKDLYKYDAFVSYNTRDEDWVYKTMLPMLERCHPSKGLQLCLHHRDFQLGRDIVDNIVDSIHNSRKTLCVVSRSYLQSEWCSMEMQLASYKLFDEMRDVLVLIFLEDIPLRELSTYHRMRKVMLKKTYITWPREPEAQKLFWAKVRKALRCGELEEDEEDLLNSDDESPLMSS